MARQFKVAIAAPNGDIDNPAFTFESDPNTGMYRLGADQLAFSTGGVANLIVDGAGVYMAEDVSVTNGDITINSGGNLNINDGDANVGGNVSHTAGGSRSTAMLDLEILAWMD